MAMYITPIFDGLSPYEATRWRLTLDGETLGYASRYHSDGKSRWYAWRDDGLRQQCASRRNAFRTLMECK